MAKCHRCQNELRDYQWALRPFERKVVQVCIGCMYLDYFGRDAGYDKFIAGETARNEVEFTSENFLAVGNTEETQDDNQLTKGKK